MHDLRLVGVHEDGEHLLLSDAEGVRFLLAVDDALRAAVRRDRPHLGQLQIEIEGGLRPRDVQSRIRAGATAEEVAELAGWPVEKVRRYEGPVIAEREHVARMAREVRLRRRGSSVTLGAEVSRRLQARGVDPDQVLWDSWRVEGDPWTVVVTFPAGGRERSARWHLDLAGRSVTPGDDEARWLSEDQPEGDGPLAGARLSAVGLSPASTPGSTGHVYDVEVDGGIGGSDAGSWSSDRGDALDLVGAMRARRQTGRGGRRRAAHSGSALGREDGLDAHSPSMHPAGRQRGRVAAPRREPLELDPSLMDDPPAAHPPAGAAPVDDPSDDRSDDRPDDRAHPLAAEPSVTPLPSLAPVSPLGLRLASPDSSSDPSPEELPPSGESAASSPAPATPRHWPLAEAMRSDSSEPSDAPPASADTPATDPSAVKAPEPATRSARRSKRPSVPSWDDIMFGAKQD
jgi:hypothetical protein